MSSRRDREKGVTLIETALVLPLLLLLALGAFEIGMAMRDWLSVTQATREGARLAAQAGDYYQDINNNADCLILEATAGALQSLTGSTADEVWIYKSDASGTVSPFRQRYRPANGEANLVCNGGWFPIQQSWGPSSRDNQGDSRDWIGVRVVFDYHWITGAFAWSGTATWNDDAVMHLEPPPDN